MPGLTWKGHISMSSASIFIKLLGAAAREESDQLRRRGGEVAVNFVEEIRSIKEGAFDRDQFNGTVKMEVLGNQQLVVVQFFDLSFFFIIAGTGFTNHGRLFLWQQEAGHIRGFTDEEGREQYETQRPEHF